MVQVVLDNVSVGFPILHLNHRSLKKSFLATATGGAILKDAREMPFVRALHDITATFQAGDRVGLVGPNGAGKTTLLRTIAGIYEPISGHVHTEGRITTLLDIFAGFNPDMTGRENIRIRGMYMGMRPREVRALEPEIEAFSELGEYLNMPLRTYSSGMQLRLAFAIATSVHPEILLMDEWVLAGDAAFMSKAQARIEEYVVSSSIFVLATHSTQIIEQWCNKAILLQAGEAIAFGDTKSVIEAYNGVAA